ALCRELGGVVEKSLRIEHHAIADHRQLVLAQYTGSQQRELVGFAVDDEGMAGIVPALEAHDDVGLFRQPVDDLALSFVAPLGADDDNVGHSRTSPSQTHSYEHDLPESRATSPDHAPCPAQITARAARMRGAYPDKGSG